MLNNQTQLHYPKGSRVKLVLVDENSRPIPVQPHEEIDFMGYPLFRVFDDKIEYIVMPPVARTLNLNWDKLSYMLRKDDKWKTKVFNLNLYGNWIQKFTCLPLEQFVRFIERLDPHIAVGRKQITAIYAFKIGVTDLLGFKPVPCLNRIHHAPGVPVEEPAVEDETVYIPTLFNFKGRQVSAVQIDQCVWVAMKPVVKQTGLSWSGQQRKIRAMENIESKLITIQTSGGPQKMLCIQIKHLKEWSCTVNTNKVDSAIRDLVRQCLDAFAQQNSKENETAYTPVVVEFHGQQLIGAEVDGTVYVAMKPIVMGMGLDWAPQYRKIVASNRYCHMAIPVQTSVNIQKMLCIPLTKLNGWLFSINPDKVAPAIRDQVILYQEECFIVLYNYFEKGAAINHRHIPNDTLTAPRQASGDLLNLSLLFAGSSSSNDHHHLIHEVNQMAEKALQAMNRNDKLPHSTIPDFTSFMTTLCQNGIKVDDPKQYQRVREIYSICSTAASSLLAIIALHMLKNDQITRSSEPIKN